MTSRLMTGLPALALILMAACSTETQLFFTPPPDEAALTFRPWGNGDGDDDTLIVRHTAIPTEKGQEDFLVLQSTSWSADEPSGVRFVHRWEGTELYLSQLEVDFKATATGLDQDINIAFDLPAVVDLTEPVGVASKQKVEGLANILFNPEGEHETFTGPFDLTWTILSVDQTVETAIGDLAGCIHAKAELTLHDRSISIYLWFKNNIGIVAIEADLGPLLGVQKAQLVQSVATTTGEDGIVLTKTTVLNAENARRTTLVTSECAVFDWADNGSCQADKDLPATILVEVRWADDERAKTDERPEVSAIYGMQQTVIDSEDMLAIELFPLPDSILHPEESGRGYRFWVGVGELDAAKTRVNSTTFMVALTDFGSKLAIDDLRVSIKIAYHQYVQ